MTDINPQRIRVANAADEEDLVQLCAALHAEIGLFGIDFGKVRATLREAYIPPVEVRRAIVGVIGGQGEPVQGAIYLSFNQEWYSPDFFCTEMFNFVYPEFRAHTHNSHDLIAWAKTVSDGFGLPLLIGVLSTDRTEAKVRHYRKQFGPPRGAWFGYGFPEGVI